MTTKPNCPTYIAATLCAAMFAPLSACSEDDGRAHAAEEDDRSVIEASGESLIVNGTRYASAASETLAESGLPPALADIKVRQQLVLDSRESFDQITGFLQPDSDVPPPETLDGLLRALLDRVAIYARGEETSAMMAQNIATRARELQASYADGDAVHRLAHAPQLQLVSGLELAFLAEGVVLEPVQSEARKKQHALCEAAGRQVGTINDLEGELDLWIDAEYKGADPEFKCTRVDIDGPCPTEGADKQMMPVLIQACFSESGDEECSASARTEVWRWHRGKWKVVKSLSNKTPTNDELEEELLTASKRRHGEDGHTLVFGGEANHEVLVTELERIKACEQVPSYIEPPDPAFCVDFGGESITLETAAGSLVQVRSGQDTVYHDGSINEGEHGRFTVRCDAEHRIALVQVELAVAMVATEAGDDLGYGSIVPVAFEDGALDAGAWFTPLQEGGQWVFRTAGGRYLSATDDDLRLGQVERVDSPGTALTPG